MKVKMILVILVLLVCHTVNALELTVDVYDHQRKPIQDIVVYLESNDDNQFKRTNKTIEINQLNKSFAPYISVTQTKSQVRFKNQDDITHHIYSPIGKNKFEFKILSGQQELMDGFANAEEIVMGCNIHDWMSGYLLVLDTPYFDKTDDKGRAQFSLEHKGDYQLTIWHPQMNEANHRISQTININDNRQIELSLTKAMAPLPEQKNKDDFDFLSDY